MAGCAGSVESNPGGEPPGTGIISGPDGNGGGKGGATPPGGGLLPDPGRVVLHRLKEVEYNNTVRQLLGTKQLVTDGLQKESAFGFDNNAAALRISTSYLERHEAVAEALVEEALAPGNPTRGQILSCDPDVRGASCARDIVRSFVRRAWRRPPTEAQVG